VLTGCGGDDQQAPAGPARSLGEAAQRFEQALDSGDCRALTGIVVHSSRRPGDLRNTNRPPSQEECRQLAAFRESFAGYRPGASRQYGTAGVVDGTVEGQRTSSVFVRDIDGGWVQFVTRTPPDQHQLGTRPADASAFDRNARKFVAAMKTGDCRALYRLLNPDSGQLDRGRVDLRSYCRMFRSALRVPDGLPARLRRARGAQPRALGKTEDNAFYALELPDGGRWTLVLAASEPELPERRKRAHSDPGVLDYLKVNPERARG